MEDKNSTRSNAKDTTEEFSQRVNNVMVNGFVAMGIATGSRLGLFDLMTKFKSPVFAAQIAQEAGMKERYVKEWLGIMVTAKIFDISADGELYYFPPHRHEALAGTKSAASVYSAALPVWGEVFEELNQCFLKDGPRGLSFNQTKNISYLLQKSTDSRQSTCPNYCLELVQAKPGLVEKLESGISILEIGSGKADIILGLARRFPKSSFIALEYEDVHFKKAREIAKENGCTNITFQIGDATNLPHEWKEKFDYVLTRNVIHDLGRPDLGLSEICRVLKANGIYSIIDEKFHMNQACNISHPVAPVLYSISLFYCMPTSLQFENGWGLGACWGIEKAKEMLSAAGFDILVDTEPPGPKSHHFHYVCCKKHN